MCRVAARLLAIANALSGMSRKASAEAAGMDRQMLRDWVIRFNAEGIAGLADRHRSGRPPWLDEGEQAVLKAMILRGPDREGTVSRLGGRSTSAGSSGNASASSTPRTAC
ncbi:helix-turn-helix domain-containing protein [Prosthecomicrobium sp. N25]